MSSSLGSSCISFFVVTVFFVLGRQCSGFGDSFDSVEWWETSLIYEISPGAYQDSDGNGQGDLQGIVARLDYIKDLGVETICLNPIYPSPFNDAGYDVIDYKNIHPLFGNLSDFDELVEEIHKRDMKIILDVIPNHSSDEHAWFIASIDRINPYTDYYVWSNGTTSENGKELPPNNWLSVWDDGDNSAWTWNEKRNQWYYHKYHESEPDLNFHNAEVRDEIMHILEFWLDRGIDGFRFFGIPYLFEDPDLRDEPILSDPQYTFGLQENIDFLYRIRSFVDHWSKNNNSSSKLLVAGSCDTQNNSVFYYGGKDNGPAGILPLNCLFTADIDIASSNASEFQNGIEEWFGLIPPNATTNWMLSNDVMKFRIASKVTSGRLDALHMLIMLLPGQAFTYYGDEIGMKDITSHKIPNTLSNNETWNELPLNTRDSALRIFMQWDKPSSNGIFANETLDDGEVNKNAIKTNVQDQLGDPNSHLNVYKKLAALRKDPVFERGDWNLESLNDDAVILLRRFLPDHPVYVVIINLAEVEQKVNVTEFYADLDDYFDVVFSTGKDLTNGSIVSGADVELLPNAGLVLRSTNHEENAITKEATEVDEVTTNESKTASAVDELTRNGSMMPFELDEVATTELRTSYEVDEVTTAELITPYEVYDITTTESITLYEDDEETTTESITPYEVNEVTTTESKTLYEVDEETTTEPITPYEVNEVTTTQSKTPYEVGEVTTTESITPYEVDEVTPNESKTPYAVGDEITNESITPNKVDDVTTTELILPYEVDEETTESILPYEVDDVTTTESLTPYVVDEETATESILTYEVDDVTTTESITPYEFDEETGTESITPYEVDDGITKESITSYEIDEGKTTESITPYQVDDVITNVSVTPYEVDEETTTVSIMPYEVDEEAATESKTPYEVDDVITNESITPSEVHEETTTKSITPYEVDEEAATESKTPYEDDDVITNESIKPPEVDEETKTESITPYEVDEETATESKTPYEDDDVITNESITPSEVDEEATTESITPYEDDDVITNESITPSEVDEEATTKSITPYEDDDVITDESITPYEVVEETTASEVDEVTTTESRTWSEMNFATTIESTNNSTDQKSITSTNVTDFKNVTTETTTPNSTTSSASHNASYDRTLLFQICISFAISYYFSKVS